VIAVGRIEVRPFSDAEIRLIETFADFVVITIENVRLFQTVERQRTELVTCEVSRLSQRLPSRRRFSEFSASTTRRSARSSCLSRAPSSTSRAMG
jgi:GAF domain-containing protein